jgi:hypothetical protein
MLQHLSCLGVICDINCLLFLDELAVNSGGLFGYFQTWMYISVPLVLYIGERTLRAFRSKAYAVKILKVTEL